MSVTKAQIDAIHGIFKDFNLSAILNTPTKENQYLCYLINEYSKNVVGPYMSLFIGRDGGLNVLLNEEYSKAKSHVDDSMNEIGKFVDKLDLNNLNKDDLEQLARNMNGLVDYIAYIKEELEK
jgi:hypothetical protein